MASSNQEAEVSVSLNDVISWIKLSPKHWLAIALVTSAILWLPDSIAEWFGVDGLAQSHKVWIGIACISSLAFLFAHSLCALVPYVKAVCREQY